MLAKLSQFSELHDASSKRWTQLSSFTALVFLLLTQNCEGGVQVVGPSQPVKATVGDDVLLSCRLEPAADASDMSVEWSREKLNPPFVFVWWDGVELESSKHPSYKGRTSLLVNKLELGEVSLKLSKVKPSDEGKYRCFIPRLGRESTVELVVGAVSVPVVSLSEGGPLSHTVELQCVSAGWYPEPELLWLDGEGKLLSAGPPETVRGPDDLYTVSSRVTVEKRHSNTFTCRVQQNNINQTRETRIHVPDHSFVVTSVVSVFAFIVSIPTVLFFRTERRNRTMKTLLQQETDERKKTENKVKTLKNQLKKLLEEKNKWTETEENLKTRIQNMKQELEKKLQEEKNKWTETEKNLKTELQNMIQKLEEIQSISSADGSSMTGPIILEEVSKHGHYIRLKNISTEDIELRGCKLKVQINNTQTAIYTISESIRLQAGGILSFHRENCRSNDPFNVDREWWYFTNRNRLPVDQMQITVITNNGEMFRLQ